MRSGLLALFSPQKPSVETHEFLMVYINGKMVETLSEISAYHLYWMLTDNLEYELVDVDDVNYAYQKVKSNLVRPYTVKLAKKVGDQVETIEFKKVI